MSIKTYYFDIIKEEKNDLAFIQNFLIENNTELISSGNYYYTNFPRTIYYKKSKESLNFLKKLRKEFYHKRTFLQKFKHLLRITLTPLVFLKPRFKINKHGNRELGPERTRGSLIIILNTRSGVKIINFDRQIIISKLNNPRLAIVSKNYEYFSLLSSPIIDIDQENNIVNEKLIEYIPFKEMSYKLFNKNLIEYFNDALSYLKSIPKDKILSKSTKELCKLYENEYISNSFNLKILKELNLMDAIRNLPRLYYVDFVGDLAFVNILFSSSGYYLHDLESKSKLNFIDIFLVFIKDLVHGYNYDMPVKNIRSGYYDKYFERLFDIFGYTYEKKYLNEYVYLSFFYYFDFNEYRNPNFSKGELEDKITYIEKVLDLFINN